MSQSKAKLFASLLHKKYRYKEGLFLAEGEKCVQEAHLAGWSCVAVIQREDSFLPEDFFPAAPRYTATAEQFGRLTDQVQPEGLLAVLVLPGLPKEETPVEGPALLLDGLQDPGNVGAIFRVADWFGRRKIILGPGTVDPFHPKVVRSSMGSIFRMSLSQADNQELLAEQVRGTIWLADLEGETLGEAVPAPGDLLVIGNEARGLSSAWQAVPAARRIRIPGGGQTESLNAAVACGILLYHWTQLQRP